MKKKIDVFRFTFNLCKHNPLNVSVKKILIVNKKILFRSVIQMFNLKINNYKVSTYL